MQLKWTICLYLICVNVYAQTHDQFIYSAKLVEVNTLHQHALQHNYAWRDTSNIITQAKNAATQGDFELAVQLLDKAKQECQLSRQQAAQQNELVDLVPYYLK
ncbi:MAG: hypothetical protein CBC79_01350 [Gammaproteobacteria bacterium TMED119]|nr:MAG: hypothetical protein CBC79_01350 [Gammaproteobacteria bacterium TMED119]